MESWERERGVETRTSQLGHYSTHISGLSQKFAEAKCNSSITFPKGLVRTSDGDIRLSLRRLWM
ncbi:hypothetical protein EYF80_038631 [Liparis tanakae]|uniref:Uncharacterized protein n=1 Tax=Liparis tanakae TaxID=230148 RepID=A0A4Z2GD75_9TELE|nr:hypothetical protein EYF80_038631 [Liparis tanakae]